MLGRGVCAIPVGGHVVEWHRVHLSFLALLVCCVAGCRAVGPTKHQTEGLANSVHSPELVGTASDNDMARARRLITEGKAQEALAMLQRAMSLAPGVEEPSLLYGGALLQTGKAKKAAKHLKVTIKRWPKSSRAHLLMAHTLLLEGKNEEASKQFGQVLALTEDPEQQISAHLGLASVYEEREEQNQANRHYAKALAIDPGLRGVLVNVQKELLWREPQRVSGEKPRTRKSNKARRERIEAELRNLRQGGKSSDE